MGYMTDMPRWGKIFPLLEPIFFPITAAAVPAKWPICLSGRGVHGRLAGVIGTVGKNVEGGVCIDADALSIDVESVCLLRPESGRWSSYLFQLLPVH